ncbi:MAG: DUF433 domain-containing protein [Chloroflexi bacterium]|nr:DUF433 domain-containing protein [Chloroflexota bacterium]
MQKTKRKQKAQGKFRANKVTSNHNRRVRLPRITTEHPHIVRVQGLHGGRPIVSGKSVTVQTIVALFRQNLSPEQIVEDYDGVLTLAEVYDALSYYHDHPGEIEQYLAENRVALENA